MASWSVVPPEQTPQSSHTASPYSTPAQSIGHASFPVVPSTHSPQPSTYASPQFSPSQEVGVSMAHSPLQSKSKLKT